MEQNKTENAIPYVRSLVKRTPALPIVGVVIALFLSVGLVTAFDAEIGHFKYGAVTFYVMTAGILAAAVISAAAGKLAEGKFSFAAVPESPMLSACASYFAAVMAAVSSAAELYDYYVLRTHTPETLELLASAFLPALTVSAILGTHAKTRGTVPRIIAALIAALAVNLNMFACYFDFTLPLNSAVRNIITIAQAGTMLFLLSEVRFALSPEKRASSPFFVFTSMFAASAVLGISFGLCVYGFVSPNAAGMGISIYRFACYFGIGLLALSRLLALGDAAVPYVAPPEADKPNPDTKKSTLSSLLHKKEK